jgi:hypothetical protein
MNLGNYLRLYRSAKTMAERERIRQQALCNLTGKSKYQFINLIKGIR